MFFPDFRDKWRGKSSHPIRAYTRMSQEVSKWVITPIIPMYVVGEKAH